MLLCTLGPKTDGRRRKAEPASVRRDRHERENIDFFRLDVRLNCKPRFTKSPKKSHFLVLKKDVNAMLA